MTKYLVISNKDQRIDYIVKKIQDYATCVTVDNELSFFYELDKKDYDYIILPIQGVDKNMVIKGTDIKLTENYLSLFKNKTILTGLLSDQLKEMCTNNHVSVKSYLNSDLAIENNYITVEGIVEYIVNHSDHSIYQSNILVIGYGRLGQITAKVLSSMKANITIAARATKDLVHAQICDLSSVELKKMDLNQYDFIINTVPCKVIPNEQLHNLKDKEIQIIDVSSAPFGLDHDYAKEIHVKTTILPGIPGKIAPKTAGELIAKYIMKMTYGGDFDG